MKNIKLPERYNYVEAYLTLRCNFNCTYCINKDGELVRERKELTAEQWVDGLNRIDFGQISLTLGGGEATIHKGFYNILRDLKPEIKVDLLTNLQFDVDELIKNIKPDRFNQRKIPAYRSIRVSYHIGQSNPEEIIEKSKKLQDAGFSVGIFGLDHPKFINENMKLMESAIENKIFFFPKNFLGYWNGRLYGTYKYYEGLSGERKKVKCRTRELLIDPAGDVYKCHRDLYKREGSLDNILNPDFEIGDKFRLCENFGECNACDLKLKTNFYLDSVDCQIEIEEVKDKED